MTNETSSIDQIERQLSKLESTATNLETISALAMRANRSQEAKTLADQAIDLRAKQFTLYRSKDRLQVDTKAWKAFVAALELVNHFIDEAMADIKLLKEVQDSAAKLILVVAKITAG